MATMLLERHVFHEDLGMAGAQRLLAWCRARGADSFTVTVIGSEPALAPAAAAFDKRLGSFALDPNRIPPVDPNSPGSHWADAHQLWKLNDDTAAILLDCFPQGLLTYYPANDTWFEDPCIYRGPELMLGIISHECEGILRIEASEQFQLDESELPYRLKGEWVGYR